MKACWSTLLLLPLAWFVASPHRAAGQTSQSAAATTNSAPRPPVSLEIRTGGASLLNLFQAPAGEPKTNVRAGTGEIRFTLPLGQPGLELHSGASGTVYQAFDPGWSLSSGLRWGGRIHRAEGTASFRARSPRMEVGDTLGFADVLHASADYSIRPVRVIQLRVLGEMDRQWHQRSREWDSHAVLVGGAARFHGFGYWLSPEMGVAAGRRLVELQEEDYDERVLWMTIVSSPTPGVYFSLRFRNRWRDYSSQSPASWNLLRQDDRKDLTLTAHLAIGPRWAWTAYLLHQDADSTKESRVFRTQYLLTSLAYRVR